MYTLGAERFDLSVAYAPPGSVIEYAFEVIKKEIEIIIGINNFCNLANNYHISS